MTRARSPLSEAVFWSVPVVLFLPALYYSLTTPFGLVDDYELSRYASIFNLPDFRHQARYRPFWDFYNAVTWTIFGPVPWLHHLARWLMVAGAVFAFTAAFSCFSSAAQTGHGTASGFIRLIRLLPRALLVYLWVFFPNQPAARLGPHEVSTVFFMGLCTWMMARMLSRGGAEEIGSTRLTHGLFVLGFFGLVWSKEVNIAVALWMLVFYCGPLLKRMDRSRIMGGLAAAAVIVHTAWAISGRWELQSYGTAPFTPKLVMDNAKWIATGLFQVDTSPVIAAGLVLLLALLPVFVAAKASPRMRFSSELLFVLFLLGQFASLYLILCTSWVQALRYWYSLVPVFTTLVAFSAKFMLELVEQPARGFGSACVRASRARLATACALAGFVLFFIGCNYSNVLLQTVVQHRARHVERELLAEITRLLDRGRHVRVIDFAEGDDELVDSIFSYYRYFLPRFHGRKYDIHDRRTDTASSRRAGEPRYWVAHGRDMPLSYEIVGGYRLLSWAHDVAAVLKLDAPYWEQDAGIKMRRWYVASTDPDYGRNGVMQVGAEGPHEPVGDLDLDARLDNSISRYIREHSIAGSLFSNDVSSVSHIHGYGSAVQIHEGLPCVGSVPSIGVPHDVHVAWLFSSSRQEYITCTDLYSLWGEREVSWGGESVIKVALRGDGPANRRGPWRWRRADAMPDNSSLPNSSTWADVDDEWGRSWQYALTPDDEGKFFRAHVNVEKDGELTRTESAVIGPIVVGPGGPTVAGRGTTTVVDLWDWSDLELVAELDAGLIFRIGNKNGISPFQATYERVVTSGKPVIDALFDVYLHDGQLTYLKGDGCNAEITQSPFFLHVTPVNTTALPPHRREHGFDSFSFDFDSSGVASNGKCFLTVPLPGYAVRRIRTGQYVPDRSEIWDGDWDE